MKHLIIGYGYCGYYLAKRLLAQGHDVVALSRSKTLPQLPGLKHLNNDVNQGLTWAEQDTVLYYFIPPSPEGTEDKLLEQFLQHAKLSVGKVIYCSTSGVYGDHQGAWIDEQATCPGQSPRQLRRLDAEKQWQAFCQQHRIPCLILRLAGIYGPHRLPTASALEQSPLINPDEAPFTNHIYVRDLANILGALGETINQSLILNIADGKPNKMGELQRLTAEIRHLPPAPYLPFTQIWQAASEMKREFMQASKRLLITRLQTTLPQCMPLTPLREAITESLKDERSSQ
ncbi:SDR family NAD(P)-dependent oxidoreductase [Legionella taurinensis]|uniref:NAD(P)-dependent oxidoreductase n=1 Tax=Legionella taurinensis TaxID=70611 RepID=A0A3A5L598_9GAMM|nr:SDR family oxidoreductase [Legionella taurinensis]MDX1837420.1 SDR family oxidoreductase [Legionella taurinensis]PUT40767.1 NAD(P)-dependent oxidoreductase [Legionella taurinensis]PUT44189.1 NAD(P)-dependent oxidoreductase [Legionella taurinensis]PUT47490.1 NAD(P)-dependent oxidoreductase [Legionella taurinensis]PUT48629.1 NAD(P)-dependent oxidoreductase [Legionella taurinensis]